MRILRAFQSAVLVFVAILTGVVCFQPLDGAQAQAPRDANADEIVRSWNEAVSTIELEDQNLRELLESYKRNPPGLVVLTPDARAAQKARRLDLCARIIASSEERIRAMQRLAKAEEASK